MGHQEILHGHLFVVMLLIQFNKFLDDILTKFTYFMYVCIILSKWNLLSYIYSTDEHVLVFPFGTGT